MAPLPPARAGATLPTPGPRARSERGFALLLVVFLVLLLGGLSFGLLGEGIASRTSLRHHETSMQALEVLESGIVRAVQEIRALVDSGTDGIGAVSGRLGGGSYDVTVARDPVNADRYLLTGTGVFGLSARRIEVAVRRRASGWWLEGLFSKESLTFRGETTSDSYDSRLGSYASQATHDDGHGRYALETGHIGSNGSIDLRGSAVSVHGNTIPGPLRTVLVRGDPPISGDRMSREFPIEIDSIPESEFLAAFARNDDASLLGPGGGSGKGNGGGAQAYDPRTHALSVPSQETIVLGEGVYFFSSVTLGAQSTLRTQGKVTLYCTGDVDLTAGTFVNPGTPADFTLYVAPYAIPAGHVVPQPEIRLRGGSSVSTALYAPDATLDLGGGCELFGAAVVENVRIHGASTFHYDTALETLHAAGVATIERLYWRELAPPAR